MSDKMLLLLVVGGGAAWYLYTCSKETNHVSSAPVPDERAAIRPGVRADGSPISWNDPKPIETVNEGIPPLVIPPSPSPLSAGVDPNFAGHDITTVTRT